MFMQPDIQYGSTKNRVNAFRVTEDSVVLRLGGMALHLSRENNEVADLIDIFMWLFDLDLGVGESEAYPQTKA